MRKDCIHNCIVITLFDIKSSKLISRHTISDEMCLVEDKSIEKSMIPIGIGSKKALHLVNKNNSIILHKDHILDLGNTLTFQKQQGVAFDKVIFWIE